MGPLWTPKISPIGLELIFLAGFKFYLAGFKFLLAGFFFGPGFDLLAKLQTSKMTQLTDPEFELHNHIDYARQSCFSLVG